MSVWGKNVAKMSHYNCFEGPSLTLLNQSR